MKVRKFVEAFDLIMMEEIELADPWDMENNNRHMVFRWVKKNRQFGIGMMEEKPTGYKLINLALFQVIRSVRIFTYFAILQ